MSNFTEQQAQSWQNREQKELERINNLTTSEERIEFYAEMIREASAKYDRPNTKKDYLEVTAKIELRMYREAK